MRVLLPLLIGCEKPIPNLQADSGTPDTVVVPLSDIDGSSLPQGPSPCRQPVLADVLYAIDGDTIAVDAGSGEETVRMIGVDTPEVGWDGEQSDCYALEAKAFAEDRLEGGQVWLTFDSSCADTYGRTLAYLHLGASDQDFFQRQLLRGGYAHDLPWSGTNTYADTFAGDVAYAQSSGEGMWGLCN